MRPFSVLSVTVHSKISALAAKAKVEPGKKYSLKEAAEIVVSTAATKFDETVDAAIRLGVNPAHADQMVRGSVVLPHGLGKTVRVLAFAKGDKEKEALEAWDERKRKARVMGETAATKLLVPMIMMLAVVMAIIMIPAFLSFYG